MLSRRSAPLASPCIAEGWKGRKKVGEEKGAEAK